MITDCDGIAGQGMHLETRRLFANSRACPMEQRSRGSDAFVQNSDLPGESQNRQTENYHDHPQQDETDGHGSHGAAPASRPRGRRQAGTMAHNILRLCKMTKRTPPTDRPSIVMRKSLGPWVNNANPNSSARTQLRATRIQLNVCFKAL